jgi:hypothetical protein
MASSRLSVSLLMLVLVHAACEGSRPTEPSPPTPEASVPLADRTRSRGLPQAVFETTPREADGRISGPAPLEVQFNLCGSRPSQPGDELTFTYDFDADGEVDEFGHCRARHTYASPAAAFVCVSDRRPGGFVCRVHKVHPTDEPDSSSARGVLAW